MPTANDIVKLKNVSRYFGGITALKDVDFSCREGSVHGILGENGAGKSTLIKILSGVLPPSEGQVLVHDKPVQYQSPSQAAKDGIVCIFQELSLIPDLSVAENIFIDQPPRRFGLIDASTQRRMAERVLARIRCEDVNPDARIRDLSLSRRQMIEIAKAISKDPRVLILDEATSALTSKDVETVYDLLAELTDNNVASLFISHRMQEVEALCDRLSVFRNGRHIQSFNKGDYNESEIVRLMIGRDLNAQYPPKPPNTKAAKPALKVSDIHWESSLKGVDLTVGQGEIVGLGGLDGQGQKELLLALFGVLKGVRGTVQLNEVPFVPTSPAACKSAAIALVPEDRKTEGLMLSLSIADNLLLPNYKAVTRGALIDTNRARQETDAAIAKLQIKTASPDVSVETLSGGNQQKVVIAKWLALNPDVILLNDPTRGIDVGTKQEIYTLIRDLANEGKAILLYSTDYAELIGCCDRVSVMYDGQIVSELRGDQLTEQAIVAAALNIQPKDVA